MDLTNLKNLGTYSMSLSLTNFLGGGKTSYFDTIAQSLTQNIFQGTTALTDASGVNIDLSDAAKALLAQGATTDAAGNSTTSGVQKTAQNFMMSFFDQSGVDFANLSPDALDLIQGLQGVIGDSAGTSRDFTTDAAEEKYNPNRKVYTLTGDGTRLRMAIEYGDDGKPQKLSITDITGGQVETADITLGQKDGKASTIDITRSQKNYANGHMTTVNDIAPLNVDLYTAA